MRSASDLKPILIGKVAPNLSLEKKDGERFKRHDFDSEYMVIFFWQKGCNHCKEARIQVKKDFEKLKALNVDLLTFLFYHLKRKFGIMWTLIFQTNGLTQALHPKLTQISLPIKLSRYLNKDKTIFCLFLK